MANTRMFAKNGFQEGLIMDISPTNSSANSLSSALNATLVTYNGNELSLQNDMGNSRVETAYLPEGYVPVGTCEFGDIIYIVSYNPLDKKAQIGCFPSPERNITSDEMSDLGQSLSYLDFQNISKNDKGEDVIDGTLKKTSVKKVLVQTKKLNPGDKYIIYTDQGDAISSNEKLLSDYGEKKHDISPKAVKLHVVSIEDSGKITYLDTTTKWYDDYYINEGAVKVSGGKTDLDSYRDLVSSEWSIFSSKTPGKLAILAELEIIDSFSCSYILEGGVITNKDAIECKQYKLILEPSYDGKDGIIVPYVCITEGSFSPSIGTYNNYVPINDVIYYNHEKEGVVYKDASLLEPSTTHGWLYSDNIPTSDTYNFIIPYKEIIDEKTKTPISSDTFIYNFSVVPTMGLDKNNMFGRLDHLKVDLSIDFNKIGTGEVDFLQWKYHNSEETSVLTYAINTYPKPGYSVKFIQMDFYDNQGHVAQYILDSKKSYNGVFNEYFNLKGQGSNTKLSRYKIPDPTSTKWDNNKKPSEQEKEVIYHNAEQLTSEEIVNMYEDDYCKRGSTYYRNDAGTLYYGALYAVKITVWQASKSNIWEKQEFYRWYWTNSMYNEYYYNTKDFDSLNFELVLDSKALFATNPSEYLWHQEEINNLGNDFGDHDHYKTYSANVQYMGRDIGVENIKMYVQAGLQNDYGCFNLSNREKNNINDLSQIKTEVFLGSAQISYNISGNQHEFSGESANVSDPVFLRLENKEIKDGDEAQFDYLNSVPINTENIKELGLEDDFNIIFGNNASELGVVNKQHTVQDSDITYQLLTTTLDKCYYQDENNKKSIPLSMSAILFNKAYTQNIYSNNISVPVYTPIINSEDDFGNLGLGVMWEQNNSTSAGYSRDDNNPIKMGFSSAMSINQHVDEFTGTNFKRERLTFTGPAQGDDQDYIIYTEDREINTSSDQEYLSKIWAPISENMGHFFLVYPGGRYTTNSYGITEGLYNYTNISKWFSKQEATGGSQNSTFIYNGAYDITDKGQFNRFSNTNMVGFLGIKHNKGFTLLNQAFIDYYNGENNFKQAARKNGKFQEFENFAYHLYLIFSNTFHKNKRIEDAQINLRNYVRNKRYEVQFTKNIVIKLSENNPNEEANIAMRGLDFKEYKEQVLTNSNLTEQLKDSKNVRLKLLDSAINNELIITINSQPLQFTDSDANAYIQYNGQLIPSNNLADDTFYLYQDGKLQQFQNKILKFNIKDVDANLRHLFSNALPEINNFKGTLKLRGVHPPKLVSLTPFQEAYKKFVGLINQEMHNLSDIQEYNKSNAYPSVTDLNIIKNKLINNIISKLPQNIDGYNKYELHRYAISKVPNTKEDWVIGVEWLGAYEVFFDAHENSIGVDPDRRYTLEIHVNNIMEHDETHKDATEYSFDTQFNLKKLFDYENNMLTLKPNAVVSNFGIKDDPKKDYSSAYTGFIKDVIIDKTFQIV